MMLSYPGLHHWRGGPLRCGASSAGTACRSWGAPAWSGSRSLPPHTAWEQVGPFLSLVRPSFLHFSVIIDDQEIDRQSHFEYLMICNIKYNIEHKVIGWFHVDGGTDMTRGMAWCLSPFLPPKSWQSPPESCDGGEFPRSMFSLFSPSSLIGLRLIWLGL